MVVQVYLWLSIYDTHGSKDGAKERSTHLFSVRSIYITERAMSSELQMQRPERRHDDLKILMQLR